MRVGNSIGYFWFFSANWFQPGWVSLLHLEHHKMLSWQKCAAVASSVAGDFSSDSHQMFIRLGKRRFNSITTNLLIPPPVKHPYTVGFDVCDVSAGGRGVRTWDQPFGSAASPGRVCSTQRPRHAHPGGVWACSQISRHQVTRQHYTLVWSDNHNLLDLFVCLFDWFECHLRCI